MRKVPRMWNKVLTFFFSVTVIFILIIFGIFCRMIFQTEGREYREEAEKRVENIAYSINRELNFAINRSENISRNLLLQEILVKEESSTVYFEEYLFLKRFFQGFTDYENYVEQQFCIYPTMNRMPENIYIEDIEVLKSRKIWEKLEGVENSRVVWDFVPMGSSSYISLYRKILKGNECLGFFENKIPVSTITEVLDIAKLKEDENVRIVLNDDTVLYSFGDDKKDGLVFHEGIIDGFYIEMSVSTRGIYNNCWLYMGISLVFILMLIFVCYFLYKLVIHRITAPFYEFIGKIEDDESILLQPEQIEAIHDEDAFRIVEKFKEMAQKINQMYLNIEKINKEKKKIELKFLQSSINPHLLYNSLSVLNWRLTEYGDMEMTNLIEYMVEYYRSVLSDGDNVITIEEELKLIKQYLKIIRFAYDKEFEVEINVDNEVLECYTIKQILQPIVENAVMHGIQKIENARLKINAYKRADKIIFEVADNGYGMEKEQIDIVLSGKAESKSRRHKGFGIKNTIERIKAYYGDECGIAIESTPGEGTRVTITIGYFTKETILERI